MTRADLAKLLASIAPPGKKRKEKLEAVKKLELKNSQGHGVHEILDSFPEY